MGERCRQQEAARAEALVRKSERARGWRKGKGMAGDGEEKFGVAGAPEGGWASGMQCR